MKIVATALKSGVNLMLTQLVQGHLIDIRKNIVNEMAA